MDTDANIARQSSKPPLTPELREWYRWIGNIAGGYRALSRETLSALRKAESAASWALRKARHGPTGRRHKSIVEWCKDNKKPLPSERLAALDKQSPSE